MATLGWLRNGISRNDLPWQAVHIDASIAKDLDAMVAIDNRPVRPHFERTRSARLQRIDQFLIGEFAVPVEFRADQRCSFLWKGI